MEKNYGNVGLRYLPLTQYLLNKYSFVEYIEWMYMNESWLFDTFLKIFIPLQKFCLLFLWSFIF